MKRKVIFALVMIMILFGLVAWQPASPISVVQPFITQDCLVQSAPDAGIVSLDSPVPSCWMVEQLH